jgi:hypothetical protein
MSSPTHGVGQSHFLTRTEKHLGASPPTQSDQPHHSDQLQSLSHGSSNSAITTAKVVNSGASVIGVQESEPSSQLILSSPDPDIGLELSSGVEPSPDSSLEPSSGHSHSELQFGVPHSSSQFGGGHSHVSVSNMSPSGSFGQS